MSLWSRIRRVFSPTDDFWYYPIGAESSSGVRVSERNALQYLTLYACVSLISGDIARLPLNLYKRRKDSGKDLITDHPLYDLLHNTPNPETTSFNFREALQGHLLLWGNSYAYIDREKRGGKIKGLWQLPDPGGVQVKRVGREIKYIYRQDGRDVIRDRSQIFHIPGYGYDGLVGMSMISLSREAIGLGIATETFGGKYFGEGTHPAGVLEMDRTLGENREEFVKNIQRGYAGLGKSHRVMLLENGMTYKPLTVPLEDAQFLETRQFQKGEIAAMYHVPVHKIGVHGQNSNYNNLEQENASYVDSCLMHWIVRWEKAISQQLLTEDERRSGLFFEFQVQGLLRGDSKARADYYSKLFQVGAMSPNQIRSLENENPIEGGDQHFVMLNMVPLDQAGKVQQLNTEEPPEKPDKDEDLKRHFRKQIRDNNSINAMSKLKSTHYDQIRTVAQNVISRETLAIKRAAEKHLGTRDYADFENFLQSFYRDHHAYVKLKFNPVFRLYGVSIMDEASRIVGSPIEMTPSLEKFMYDYFENFAFQHCRKGQEELMSVLRKSTKPEALENVIKRVNEWYQKSPDKIAMDQSNRLLNALTRESWKQNGVKKLRWAAIGQSCPFCTSLSGKVVSIEKNFIDAGSVMYVDTKTGDYSWYTKDGGTFDDPDAPGYSGSLLLEGGKENPNVIGMKFYGSKFHPPIHQGCDCIILPD